MRNKKRVPRQREQAVQLELALELEAVTQEVTKLPDVPVEVVQEIMKPETPESWTVYSNSDRQYDAQRRDWLRAWIQEHDTSSRYWFTMWGRYSGFYQTHLLPGRWAHFVEDAGYYEIYCLFVGVFTPGVPLAQYMEDAAARGEIKGLVTKG